MTYGLEEFVQDLAQNNLPGGDALYEYFSSVNTQRLNELLLRLDRVRGLNIAGISGARKAFNATGAVRQHAHVTAGSVKGEKTRLTGLLLEQIVRLLCKECRLFIAVTNLHTTTAEIDLLLELGPTASVVPMFRNAGTHVIGEAKCYATGFSGEWVNELAGLMTQHQCNLSVLFVASPSKVLRVNHRHGLQLHSVQGKNVVPFGLAQVKEIASGANFLSVLSKQFIRMQTGANELAI